MPGIYSFFCFVFDNQCIVVPFTKTFTGYTVLDELFFVRKCKVKDRLLSLLKSCGFCLMLNKVWVFAFLQEYCCLIIIFSSSCFEFLRNFMVIEIPNNGQISMTVLCCFSNEIIKYSRVGFCTIWAQYMIPTVRIPLHISLQCTKIASWKSDGTIVTACRTEIIFDKQHYTPTLSF